MANFIWGDQVQMFNLMGMRFRMRYMRCVRLAPVYITMAWNPSKSAVSKHSCPFTCELSNKSPIFTAGKVGPRG
jgi:hypothetical protein